MKFFIPILAIIFIVAFLIVLKGLQLPAKIRKAEDLIDNGEYNSASSIIKAVLERKKDYSPARYLRALILLKQNQYLLAISEFNTLLNIPDFGRHVNEADIHYHLAFLYGEIGNFQKEIEEYKSIIIFNPDDIRANQRLGHSLYQQKKYKSARDFLEKAVLLDPSLNDCYLPLAISYFYTNEFIKSEEFLIKVLQGSGGENPDAEFYLGSIYKEEKNFDEAALMLEKSSKSKKYQTKSLHLLGDLFFKQNRFGPAIDYLEKGISTLTDDSDETLSYRYLLAECYELENRIREAIEHWEIIAKINPVYRNTKTKIESYRAIVENENLMAMFTSSLEELQPVIADIITSMGYSIINREIVSSNEYQYKAYNIKRTNDPPALVYFNRTTREISDAMMHDFINKMESEKCKSGIYISTSKYSLRAKSTASSKMVELYDSDFVNRTVSKIKISRTK